MKRIVFVPTSHIAEQSLLAVRHAIEKEEPDCVAIELDRNRYHALLHGKQSNMDALKSLGFITFLIFFFMKTLQSWLGKKVGIFPGSEMLGAIKEAQKKEIPVVFIDRDIRLTFIEIQRMPKKEKLRILWLLIRSPLLIFLSKFSRSSKKIDLRKVPEKEIISEAMQVFKKEFPIFYKILVSDRNIIMAQRIKTLSERFDKIVVVIGAGHYEGIMKILGK
ncbi:MAG: TraB/GumN family protein [Nanoarchaeota archaeon]|nr:TraB/GumN family protein [Nanoarchaeota archaeon]MBU1135638.1 TraB/GumN family protein [Nanoarchaeota archaeon]MBU2520003.1 TraB/GumN family protein [Nanoarchaeota archaeon]